MRPIDADALLARMKKAMESGSNLNGTFHLHIEHAPTITRPTGEWTVEAKQTIYGQAYILTCSECGERFSVTEMALPEERYCRHCGAKMSKGGDDE